MNTPFNTLAHGSRTLNMKAIIGAGLLALGLAPTLASAQTYPSKPIRILTGFSVCQLEASSGDRQPPGCQWQHCH